VSELQQSYLSLVWDECRRNVVVVVMLLLLLLLSSVMGDACIISSEQRALRVVDANTNVT